MFVFMSLTVSIIYEENHVMTYTYSYLHRYRFGRFAHNLFVTFAGFAIILLKNYLKRHINYTWLLHIFFVIGRSLRVN